MKIGVNLMLWTGNLTRKALPLIDKVGRMGFDGVELPIFDPKKVDVAGTRRVLADNKLGATVSTALAVGSLISDSPRERKAGLDYVMAVLDVSKAVGAELLCGPLYSPVGHLVGRGRTTQEWKHAVAGLRKVADRAEELEMTIGIEALNRFETYFLNTCDDAAKLCKQVGSPRVGVHFDTFHANIEEKDPPTSLRRLGRQLVHVHACENDRGIPGSGHVQWGGIITALTGMKYDRWVTIESFVPAIKEIARAASIWRPVAKSGDELATKGLRFLQASIRKAF
ncbi:MAG TPA: sugar phosphate isomerase/epimerase [Phycisphaerae bacterium]|nr:sugar phosphate isomerase/epimerase [Phycisphaerae bacterium]